MTTIVFGSPEANAIAEETRRLERQAATEEQTNSAPPGSKLERLRRERKDLETEIDDLEDELADAHYTLSKVNDQIRELEASGGQSWPQRLSAWNAWAKGKQPEHG